MEKQLHDYLRGVRANYGCGTYLAFTVFYASHGVDLPEGHCSVGWYVMIDDPSQRGDDVRHHYGDPLGPFETPEEAIAQAKDEGWVDGNMKDNFVHPDRLPFEWE